jgi:hypothetical protein
MPDAAAVINTRFPFTDICMMPFFLEQNYY